MNDISLFILEIIMSLILSSIVLIIITTPLMNYLKVLCNGEKEALFWLAYTRAMLYLSPLLSVIVIGAVADAQGLAHIKVALISALGGLFAGLVIIGRNVYLPKESCQTPKTSAIQ